MIGKSLFFRFPDYVRMEFSIQFLHRNLKFFTEILSDIYLNFTFSCFIVYMKLVRFGSRFNSIAVRNPDRGGRVSDQFYGYEILKGKIMNPKHILVVDDDEGILSILSRALRDAGFQVTIVNDSTEALFMLVNRRNTSTPVDLLVTDFNMPKLTGLSLIDELRNEGVKLPSLLMSGNLDETMASEAHSRGCVGFLKKPFPFSVLFNLIRQVFETGEEREELRSYGM